MLLLLAIIVLIIILLFLTGGYLIRAGITKDHKLLIEYINTNSVKARYSSLGLADKDVQKKCASVESVLTGIMFITGAIAIAVVVITN